jgi:hypothetical protein
MGREIKRYGVLDILTGKLISRKFLAWIVACIFLSISLITANEWVLLTSIWIGAQGAIDFFKVWKSSDEDFG